MNDAEVQLVVVDAANVVGSRPDGWWRDRAGAARRLIAKLTEYQARAEEVELVVVLEGAARAAVDGEPAAVRVVAADGSGDDAIVAAVAAARGGSGGNERVVIVVTADRGLRERAEALGASTVGPRWLWERID
jgi:hypothetical protein